MIDLNKTLSYFFKRNGWSRNSINDFKQALRELDVTVTEVTYKELLDLANTSNLESYRPYKITDFQTIHIIPESYTPSTDANGNITNKDEGEINKGPVEPIIVQAATNSELFAEAYSTEFPQDILYYSLNPNRVVNSEHFPDSHKGFIYRRIDTEKRIDIPEDWRAVKYRRWAIGSNNKGFKQSAYILPQTSFECGSNDALDGPDTLTADDDTDYIDILPLYNKRVIEWGDRISNIKIHMSRNWTINGSFSEKPKLINWAFIGDDPIGSWKDDNNMKEECFDIEIGRRSFNGYWTFIGDGTKDWNIQHGLQKAIISFLSYGQLGSPTFIRQSIITGRSHLRTFDSANIDDSEFLSFHAYSSGTDQAIRGEIKNVVLRETDNDGNVVNNYSFGSVGDGDTIQDVTGLRINKASGLSQFYITGFPPSWDYNQTLHFGYTFEETPSGVKINLPFGHSNYSLEKALSSGNFPLTYGEANAAGILKVDVSGGSDTLSSLGATPNTKPLRIKATGGNSNTLTIDSANFNLPSSTGGTLTLSDNDLDFADIEMVNGTPTVVNYGTY